MKWDKKIYLFFCFVGWAECTFFLFVLQVFRMMPPRLDISKNGKAALFPYSVWKIALVLGS